MRHIFFVLMPALLALAVGCNSDDVVRSKGKGGGANNPPANMPDPIAQNNPPPQPPPPQPQKGEREFGPAPVVKKPKSLLGNIRARGDDAARRNEMNQIRLFYQQYAIQESNAGRRSVDGFLNYIKRDSPVLHGAIKEKYYTVNVRAQAGEDIVVYETEMYTQGYHCAKVNGFMGFVSEDDWKKHNGNP